MEVEHLPNSGVVLQCLHAMENGDIKKVELNSINVHATNLVSATTKACPGNEASVEWVGNKASVEWAGNKASVKWDGMRLAWNGLA